VKEGSGVKLAVWLLTIKSHCRQRETYRWKVLDKGYNFSLDLIAIGGLHKKLWALKVAGVLVITILRLSLGSRETKSHLDVAPVEWCRVYYMGEGDGFPRVQAGDSFSSLSYCIAMVSLVSPKSPVARPSTKGAPESELTNSWLVGCKSE
jgi:hypothetical protein